MDLIYKTKDNILIFVRKGTKSEFDFIVKFKKSTQRKRTIRYIHLIVDFFRKYDGNKSLTMQFKDFLIQLYKKINIEYKYPPKLVHFNFSDTRKFCDLNHYGNYSVEFLMVMTELIFLQEKINYGDNGHKTLDLLNAFGVKDDFTVINIATRNK